MGRVGRVWDVVVVGAGPGGSLAARQLAHRGASVLLVDKARFPRDKVCGCCVNAAALRTLEKAGLGGLAGESGGPVTNRFRLAAVGGGRVDLQILPGRAVSRRAFDDALSRCAVRAGAVFKAGTTASLAGGCDAYREVRLRGGGLDETVGAKLVMAADGLGGRLMKDEEALLPRVSNRSRMGAATLIEPAPAWCGSGDILMACGRGGYVGLVRIEDGQLNVAAAFDRRFVKQQGGCGGAAAAILQQTKLPAIPQLTEAAWQGTAALTQRRRWLGAHRLIVLGDATGYVEPFTGEGIGWAMMSAVAAEPFAIEAIEQWRPQIVRQWTKRHRRAIGRRQRCCRLLRRAIRHPAAVGAAVNVLAALPWVGAWVVRGVVDDSTLNDDVPVSRPGGMQNLRRPRALHS